MERLSALDAEFLLIEDGIAHMHIAGISVFEGPRPELEELTALVAAKLHRIPRYRQRVRTVPFELGRPVWVDDPHFDLGYHVRHTALPAPGDDAALRRLMSRLMGQALDRDRPLWELWFVEDSRATGGRSSPRCTTAWSTGSPGWTCWASSSTSIPMRGCPSRRRGRPSPSRPA